MCFASVVYDQFTPHFPTPNQWVPQPAPVITPSPALWTPEQLRELIDSFRAALEAAENFDKLTGQPDCEDPEKAKLEERVGELERKLAEMSA